MLGFLPRALAPPFSTTMQNEPLNRDIYLNHLSPTDAVEYEIARNVLLMILGGTILDILVYIPDDIQIIKRSRLRFVIFCFIFSRLFAAAYILSNVIRRTMPLDNTHTALIVGSVLCVASIGSSSYLFLQRVRAVYADSPKVRWFFSLFWFAYGLSEITIILGIKPTFIPETRYYQDSGIHPIVALSILTGIIFDTAVFLAISYKVVSTHASMDDQIRWSSLVSGKALPRLSRAVLQSGQQYYLLVVGTMIFVGIFLYLSSIHQILKGMFVAFLAPLIASMACRVFRNIKLFDSDVSSPYPISEIQFL